MLSIVIPTLNEEKYLPLLLKEIKKQDFDDYEIIVADADSADRTVEIAKSFGCKIVKGGLGLPSKGRNEGAKIAIGDTFLFLDADTVFLPRDFLDTLIKEFRKNNLGAASFSLYPNGSRLDKLAYGVYNWWVKLTQKFLPHATSAVLVKKEIHQKIKGFDEEIKIGEDHDYARRAKKHGKFGFIEAGPVLFSFRRFEREGRLKIYLKYLLAGLWMLFFGPIKSNIFNYQFGLLKDKED